MNSEIQPAHLRYILQEEIYLLPADKVHYSEPQQVVETTPEPVVLPQVPAAATHVTQVPVEEAPVAKTLVEPVKYMGGNQKSLLVLANYSDAAFMTDAHLTALQNTLTRIGYSQNDIAIVNLAGYADITWARLSDELKPKKVVLLGKESLPAGMEILSLNEVKDLQGITALYTTSFAEMMGNKEKITAFWNQIKTF